MIPYPMLEFENEMERLLKAQKLACADVERGVTLDMVKKNREEHKLKKEHRKYEELNSEEDVVTRVLNEKVHEMVSAIAAETLRNAAVDNLLATIDATEALEDHLRAKYNV